MAWSLVYIVTLTMVVIATFRSGALFRLLTLLAVSVLSTLALAAMKYDEDFLWAALISPPAIMLTILAVTTMLDRITRRAWHL